MSQRRTPRQTQLTRDSWREARPASSSQSKARSSSSSEIESDHDMGAIQLAPTLGSQHQSPRKRSQRVPGTQRRLHTESEDDDEPSPIRTKHPAPGKAPLRRSTRPTAAAKAPVKAVSDSDSDIQFVGVSRSQSPKTAAVAPNGKRQTGQVYVLLPPPFQRVPRKKASSEDDASPRVRTPSKRKQQGRDDSSEGAVDTPKKARSPEKRERQKPRGCKPLANKSKPRASRMDPDDEDTPNAETEDEGLAEIELDEPERFKTDTRLRQQKGSKFLQGLQKLKGKRTAQRWPPRDSPSTVSEEDDDDDEDDEEEASDASENFIATDDDSDGVALPEEFSLKRESPEYKFKVVFQYLILLVVKGPDILPLKGEDDAYFGRQVRDVRKMMRSLRDSMAGSLWRPEFRTALETYPLWKQAQLDEMETFCDACNRRKQRCYKCAWLRGRPYDPETHQDEYDSDGSSSSGSDDSDERDLGDMGNLCLQRARDFHELSHWEHQMYLWVRRRYHALLRAKMVLRKQQAQWLGTYREPSFDSLATDSSDSEGGLRDRNKARRENSRLVDNILKSDARHLPRDVYDVDQVTEWMDGCGWQKDSMKWLHRVQQRARNLEGHE